jgi:hypothetical protein
MGLDISVYKVKKTTNPDEIEDFYILSDFPELEVFKDFVFEKTNTYYDIEGSLNDLGYKLDEVEWRSTNYGKIDTYLYVDKKHELYDAFVYLGSVWDKCYFDTKKDLKESEYYQKYLEFLPLLKKSGYRPSYKFLATGTGKTYYCLNSANHFCVRKVKFKLKGPKTFQQVDRCIAFDEVGYQRKGANTQFYADDMWDSPCILTSEVLLSHWKKYFSYKTPESKGGWGSGVEFTLEDYEMKYRFKENIIDNFIEGETFVIYH